PNPCAVGALTFGPWLSFHDSSKLQPPFVRTCQVTASRPVGTDGAPCLRALVASSCRTSAKWTAACASSRRTGPGYEGRLALGAPITTCSLPSSITSAPCILLLVSRV